MVGESNPTDPVPQGEERIQFWSVYWSAALDKWREDERNISRTTSLMLGAAALFELINRNLINEISVSFIKTSQVEFTLAIIPIVIGYLFLSTTELAADVDWLSRSYQSAFERHYKGNDPDHETWYRIALAPSGGVFNAIMKEDYKPVGKIRKFAYVGNFFKATIFVLWPPVFVVYSSVQVLHRFGYWNLLIWGSIGTAVLLTVFALATFLSAPDNP